MEEREKSIRMGELTTEFHLEGEIGVLKGKWRRREECSFGPSKAHEQRHRVVTSRTLPNTTV